MAKRRRMSEATTVASRWRRAEARAVVGGVAEGFAHLSQEPGAGASRWSVMQRLLRY
jgi:hypothetical protein